MKVYKPSIFTILILLILLSSTKSVYSQLDYEKSYSLGVTNLSLLDFTFIYTKQIKDLKYLEITNSLVIHKTETHNNGNVLLLTIQDPYKLYDLYRFRIGVRKFKENTSNYITPLLIFNVGSFRNRLIKKYYDDKGSDATDVDYLLTRTKFEVGAIFKFGHVKTYNNNFHTDIYGGVGFKVKFMNDNILEKRPWPGNSAINDSPIHDFHIGFMPTFHFGLMFGYAK